jgi:hypothetical protein
MSDIKPDDSEWFNKSPLLYALDRCLAEFRTPITIIKNCAQILHLFTNDEKYHVISKEMTRHCSYITDKCLNEEFFWLKKTLLRRYPELDTDYVDNDIFAPNTEWSGSLNDLVIDIARKVQNSSMSIYHLIENFEQMDNTSIDQEIRDDIVSSKKHIDHIIYYTNVLAELLSKRVRRECPG